MKTLISLAIASTFLLVIFLGVSFAGGTGNEVCYKGVGERQLCFSQYGYVTSFLNYQGQNQVGPTRGLHSSAGIPQVVRISPTLLIHGFTELCQPQ